MSSEPLVPITDDLPDGVLHIGLPTPYPVGAVNCYVLVDEPVTVIDPGMLWSDSTEQLRGSIEAAGLQIEDVDQVLITHGHPDHFGAAGWLADEADAQVVCGRPELPKLVDGIFGSRLSGAGDRLGIPPQMQEVFMAFYDGVRRMTHPIAPHRLAPVDDGGVLEAGGRTWQVHVTPGHSVGHLALFDPTDRVLFSGDHLLACITPNPVLEPDPDSPDGRRRSLVEYLASLDRFTRLDPMLVLPGHGPRFRDVPVLVEKTRRHHDLRANEIFEVLERLPESTSYELSCALFPHIKDFGVMLGISEVVGHLDLIEQDGHLHRTAGLPTCYSVR